MSIICRTDKGWVISHYDYTKKIYTNVLSHSGLIDLTYNRNLFNIVTPLMRDSEARNFIRNAEKEFVFSSEFKKKKICRSDQFDYEVSVVQCALPELISLAQKHNYFTETPTRNDYLENNRQSRIGAQQHFDAVSEERDFRGGNASSRPLLSEVFGKEYVIPPDSLFISCDIKYVEDKLNESKFDFILIDPPWWNKFVRRRKRKHPENEYSMINNNDINNIKVSKFLNKFGLVGVWCTNAPSHIEAVKNVFFKSWNLHYVSTWFWVKTTQCGDLICPMVNETRKRPYERIIFGAAEDRIFTNPDPDMVIVSVPSAVHSHKPPLVEIINNYLPENPKCLELFARYLLPNWTSIGNQVLSLQSRSLYESSVA